MPTPQKPAYAPPSVKFADIPLLIAVGIQGLPLGKNINIYTPQLIEETHAINLERASSIGINNSIIPLAVWGGAYIAAMIYLLRHNINKSFYLLAHQWPIWALILLAFTNLAWSPNPAKVLMNLVHGSGIIFIATAAALRNAYHPLEILPKISYVLGINLSIQIASFFISPNIAIGLDGRLAGLTGHPNTLGAISFCSIWASSSAILLLKPNKKLYLCLLISLVTLASSGSVTAMLVTAAAVASLILMKNKNRIKQKKVTAYALMSISPPIILWLMIKWEDLTGSFTSITGKSSNFSGRTEIWATAHQLIKDRLILGWGFDDNALVISKTNFPYTSFHNGFLDIAVRGGLISFTLAIIFIFKFAKNSARVKNTPLGTLALSFLVAFTVHNISESSIFIHRNILWILMIFLFTTLLLNKTPNHPARLDMGMRSKFSAKPIRFDK